MRFEDVMLRCGDFLRRFVDYEGQKMVVQVRPDAREVGVDPDAQLLQIVGRADTGQQ
jgi:hypothetical protein